MLVNNNTQYTKPRSYSNFKGNKNPENSQGKVRYKHYEQISDELLIAKSAIQAHKKVENSSKVRLYKALPDISAALIGTTIALAQPGKLANKAAAGLGFLALNKGAQKTADIFTKTKNNDDTKNKKTSPLTTLLAIGTSCAVGAVSAIAAKKAMNTTKVGQFVKKEINALSKEINSTKAATFVENHIEPFVEKNKNKVDAAAILGTFGIISAESAIQNKLSDSINKDFKEQTVKNYKKGKAVQKLAKIHFNSIDAVEV